MTDRIFGARLAFKLGVQLRDLARREARSETISRSLQVEVLDFDKVRVATPFYWARWYHDGRGAIRARPGHKLVYFKDPSRDPRIPNKRYPVRASDVRPLTRAEFYRYLRDPSSGMIVTDRVGPAKGDPFFTRAGRIFKTTAGRTVERETSAYIQQQLKDVLRISDEVTFYL